MPESPQPGYERRDVTLRGVAIAAGITLVGFTATLLLSGWVLGLGEPRPGSPEVILPTPGPAVTAAKAPLLQENPQRDLAALQAEQTERLSSYGWVDRRAGIAHVPIERAMARVVERGLPRWEAAPDGPAARAHRARQRALAAPEDSAP